MIHLSSSVLERVKTPTYYTGWNYIASLFIVNVYFIYIKYLLNFEQECIHILLIKLKYFNVKAEGFIICKVLTN